MATAAAQSIHPERKRRFYITMSMLFICIVAAAFLPSVIDASGRLAPLTPLVAAHGLVFLAWLVLFLAQTTLVAAGEVALHRRLGAITASLMIPMFILGYFSSIAMARRGFDLSGDLNIKSDPLFQLVFPLGDLVTFCTLTGAALWYRRRPEVHKRLMLMGTIGALMPAPIAHFVGHNLRSTPNAFVPIFSLLLIVPAISDRVRYGRFHPISLWGGLLIFLWGNLRATIIGPSAAWHEFAAWLMR